MVDYPQWIPRTVSRNSTLTDDQDEKAAFLQMAREFPVRTGIYTFGLPVFAALQLVNAFVFEGSLLIIGAFALLMVACSVQLTRYHIAGYRRRNVETRLLEGEK